jgi:hypothetical protein
LGLKEIKLKGLIGDLSSLLLERGHPCVGLLGKKRGDVGVFVAGLDGG